MISESSDSLGNFENYARLPVKLAVLVQIAPPAPFYGHVILLYRMLKGIDPDDYCIISDRSRESGSPPFGQDSTPRLTAGYHFLRPDFETLARQTEAPAYNRESLLDEVIQSVQGQDYPNVDWVMVPPTGRWRSWRGTRA